MVSNGIASFDTESAKFVHFNHLAEHASPPPLGPFPVSFVPPNAYWTSVEKAAFFQGLARHSRWRPDLICDAIGGGKSIADVCSYMELLEQGLQEVRGSSRSSGTVPTAREVSDDWVRAEDSMAEALRNEEGSWQLSALKRKRKEEVRVVKKSLKQGDRLGDDDVDIGPGSRDQGSDEEEKTWQERLKQRKQEFAAIWKREDLLLSLDGKYLRAMEAMVRTLEQNEEEGKIKDSFSGGQARLSIPPPSDPAQPTTSAILGLTTPSHPHLYPSTSGSFNDSHIDPALLSLDKKSLPAESPTEGTPLHSKDPGSSKPQASLSSPTRPSNAASNDDRPSGSPKIPKDLSPTSKRRIRKRLWMRKKRAVESGLAVSDVSTDVRKLKPGRKGTIKGKRGKAKVQATDAEADDTYLIEGKSDILKEEDEGETSEDSEQTVKKKPPGWANLGSVGVDANFIRTAGLDLFSLSNTAGLARMMTNVYQFTEEFPYDDDEETTPALSYHFLLLLRAHLVYFLSRFISQILTQKDVQAQQKKRVKRGSHVNRVLKIKPNNIQEALKIMDYTSTRRKFFRRLKKLARVAADARDINQTPLESSNSKRHIESDSSSSSSDSDSESDGSNISEPSTDETTSFSLPHNFIPQSEFGFMWNVTGDQGDALLDDFDEDALIKELKAEEVVDLRDQVADRAYEKSLWEGIGVQQETTPQDVKVKSTKERKPRRPIKSRMYIDDSDEEDGEFTDQ